MAWFVRVWWNSGQGVKITDLGSPKPSLPPGKIVPKPRKWTFDGPDRNFTKPLQITPFFHLEITFLVILVILKKGVFGRKNFVSKTVLKTGNHGFGPFFDRFLTPFWWFWRFWGFWVKWVYCMGLLDDYELNMSYLWWFGGYGERGPGSGPKRTQNHGFWPFFDRFLTPFLMVLVVLGKWVYTLYSLIPIWVGRVRFWRVGGEGVQEVVQKGVPDLQISGKLDFDPRIS